MEMRNELNKHNENIFQFDGQFETIFIFHSDDGCRRASVNVCVSENHSGNLKITNAAHTTYTHTLSNPNSKIETNY